MAAVSVTTSATTVYTATHGTAGYPEGVLVTNDSGNDVYFSKSSGVTTSTGVKVASGGALGINLLAGEILYGIAGSTSEVRAENF